MYIWLRISLFCTRSSTSASSVGVRGGSPGGTSYFGLPEVVPGRSGIFDVGGRVGVCKGCPSVDSFLDGVVLFGVFDHVSLLDGFIMDVALEVAPREYVFVA